MRPPTNISTDSLPTVTEPPTKIENNEMVLDPAKVIKAWADSATVLKEVATILQESQEDNERLQKCLERNSILMIRFGATAMLVHVVTTGALLWAILVQ